jgi:hypothetical protein
MDELLHHCLRELSFDGDLGMFFYHVINGDVDEERRVRFLERDIFWSFTDLMPPYTQVATSPG